MEFNEEQINLLNRRKTIVLATADPEGQPRAILVEVNKAEWDRIIVTDNEMETTIIKAKRTSIKKPPSFRIREVLSSI